ncbi:hypothetical protein C1I91_10380 [Clostridium manihotivorum]|uniref:Uncharacterized protein n=1 Tax=Clostridium manihotivorum TaxID=2320868 RepID=A0A3R5U8Q8_9CLOT|nr:hypothetical protein C1I91_10380 [Clostridium manihotivorum]
MVHLYQLKQLIYFDKYFIVINVVLINFIKFQIQCKILSYSLDFLIPIMDVPICNKIYIFKFFSHNPEEL